MTTDERIQYLIVDTSAFIKDVPLQEIGINIITEQDVIDEITNKRQLRRLVVLPYDLKVQSAFPENIKFVTEFSKKTGDYPSLSATDIKVIALTYQLEKENIGTKHLKETPTIAKTITVKKRVKQDNVPIDSIVGFYFPQQRQKVNSECKRIVQEININDSNELASGSELATFQTDYASTADLIDKFENLNYQLSELEIQGEDGSKHNVNEILVPVKKVDDKFEEEEQKEEEKSDKIVDLENEFDDCNWITPSNIKDLKKQMDSNLIKNKLATVACLTTDFAMQNVLMQIGLNVASLDGRVIKQMRTFILRCYACFKTTSIMTKMFCPNCGNKTLKKVSVSMDDEGKQHIYINTRKPLSAKGKRFSLPTPKGGKHADNPILYEDQPVPQQRPSKLARTKNNPLQEDYIAGYSPFIMRDVNSKSAMLGIRPGGAMKYCTIPIWIETISIYD